jgi:pyruvate,water dikinase
MIQTVTEDFRVEWTDPGDARETWEWDQMHFPRPMPPLALQLIAKLEAEIMGARCVSANGYHYALNSVPPPPTPEVLERGPLPVWENDYTPRVREICERMRSTDYEGMTAVQLADSLDGITDEAVEAFRYTMVLIFAFMGPTFSLVDFCEKELGADGSQVLATLLQGYENGSAAAGAGLGELAELAARLPAVAESLKQGKHDDLQSVAGGKEFLAALKDYLEEYGWRAESWGLPHVPTWSEDPGVPLTLIGHYLRDASLSPADAIARSRQQREDGMKALESRLSPEKLEELVQRLTVCQSHVPISEGRAQWQLTIIGSFRVPVLALGKKFVQMGVMDEPGDAFFLTVEELKNASRNSEGVQSLVKRRKDDLERWEHLTPPPFLGAPPADPPPEMHALVTKFFGLGVVPSTNPKIVTGNGASRGVVRGRARVIRDLSEAGRLEKGEILVCSMTAPPWTPLFAIAAAVVTDTGGILSHSAICAREYGLPCVVGTQVGTRQIPDGAVITVDGGEGTVTIED